MVLGLAMGKLTRDDLWGFLEDTPNHGTPYAYVEKVGGFMASYGADAMTDEGKSKRNLASAHSMFTFGQGYGEILMALTAGKIPYEEVPPQKWQKGMGIEARRKSEDKTRFKQRLKARAQELFPSVRVTNAIADALLIAEFCRRTEGC